MESCRKRSRDRPSRCAGAKKRLVDFNFNARIHGAAEQDAKRSGQTITRASLRVVEPDTKVGKRGCEVFSNSLDGPALE
jgi:hypothetical protein